MYFYISSLLVIRCSFLYSTAASVPVVAAALFTAATAAPSAVSSMPLPPYLPFSGSFPAAGSRAFFTRTRLPSPENARLITIKLQCQSVLPCRVPVESVIVDFSKFKLDNDERAEVSILFY